MNIQLDRGPVLVGEEPSCAIVDGPDPVNDPARALGVMVKINGITTILGMSPEEARDFACGIIVASHAVAARIAMARANAARSKIVAD